MTTVYNSYYIYNIYTGQSMSRTYSRVVMPQFPELSSLPAPVFSSLCASSGPLVNFFRSCFAIKLPAARSCEGVRPYLNSIQLQVELVFSGCLTQILDIYIWNLQNELIFPSSSPSCGSSPATWTTCARSCRPRWRGWRCAARAGAAACT